MKRQGQFNVPTLTVCREVVANPAVREYLQGTTKPNQTYSELIDNLKRLHVAYSRQSHGELTNSIEPSLTNMVVLRAATSLPAKLHSINDRSVITPGKRADLMLLNIDPLVNMRKTSDIAPVWIDLKFICNVLH
ncbi:hypothetical protein FALCPG4_017114 [Fusarium falciforme]